MTDDPYARFEAGRTALLARLDELQSLAVDDPRRSVLVGEVQGDMNRVLDARRDIETAQLRLPCRIAAALAVVLAAVALIGWYSSWLLVPAVAGIVVAAAVVLVPPSRSRWEPGARLVAVLAAVLGAGLAIFVSGWAAVVVLAGAGWWAWRYLT